MISARFLLIMAQTWLVLGSLSLVLACVRLFRHAIEAGMPTSYLFGIVPVSILAGAFKARMVMRRRMRANIRRLSESSAKMWPWQIYPPQLLAFILTMVILMAVLKRVFVDNGLGLGILGGVDLAVAVALGVASLEYRNRQNEETITSP